MIRVTRDGESFLIEADAHGLNVLGDAVDAAQGGNSMVIGDPGRTLTIQQPDFVLDDRPPGQGGGS